MRLIYEMEPPSLYSLRCLFLRRFHVNILVVDLLRSFEAFSRFHYRYLAFVRLPTPEIRQRALHRASYASQR